MNSENSKNKKLRKLQVAKDMPPRKGAFKPAVVTVTPLGCVSAVPTPRTKKIRLPQTSSEAAKSAVAEARDEAFGITPAHINTMKASSAGIRQSRTNYGGTQMSLYKFLADNSAHNCDREDDRVADVFRHCVCCFNSKVVYGYEVDASFIVLCMTKCALTYGAYHPFKPSLGTNWLTLATKLVCDALALEEEGDAESTEDLKASVRLFLSKLWVFVLQKAGGEKKDLNLKKSSKSKDEKAEEARAEAASNRKDKQLATKRSRSPGSNVPVDGEPQPTELD